MRYLLVGATMLLGLFVLFGCGPFAPVRHEQGMRNPPLSSSPTAEELVHYLNANASRVPALKVNNLYLDAHISGQPAVTLEAKMSLQKPRDFGLQAKLAGQNMLLLGSNKDEFWYWFGKAPEGERYLFHCSYEDYNSGRARAMQLPFQPEWLTEALGIATYDETPGKYQLSTHGGYLELDERVVMPLTREEIHKVTVFNNSKSAQGSRVVAHLLRDKKGNQILAAHVLQTQVDPQSQAVLPRVVKIECALGGEKAEMKLELNEIQVLPRIDEREAAYLFNRSRMNVPGYDLARGPDGGSGLQPASGNYPR